jgi:hypothetical protein
MTKQKKKKKKREGRRKKEEVRQLKFLRIIHLLYKSKFLLELK